MACFEIIICVVCSLFTCNASKAFLSIPDDFLGIASVKGEWRAAEDDWANSRIEFLPCLALVSCDPMFFVRSQHISSLIVVGMRPQVPDSLCVRNFLPCLSCVFAGVYDVGFSVMPMYYVCVVKVEDVL